MVGSPVFIRTHFSPDVLQDLKQSAISFPTHVKLEDELGDLSEDKLEPGAFGFEVALRFVGVPVDSPIFALQPYVIDLKLTMEHLKFFFVQ